MRTRSASANSGAQRVVDDIKEEPADESLAQFDHDLEPLDDGIDNNQTSAHAATETIDEQLNTFVSRMITRSARLNARRTTSPTTTPEPEIHTPTTTSRVTRRSTRTATPTPITTATTGRITKPSSSSTKTNKPLPPIPNTPHPSESSKTPSTSSSKPPTSLFCTLSPAQKVTRKRKLSTIKSTLKRKSVEQLTDLYNSTEDPDFQTLMTEVYHENCMSRLEGWERSLTDE